MEFRLSFKVVRVALQLYYTVYCSYIRIFLDREKKEARKLLPIF